MGKIRRSNKPDDRPAFQFYPDDWLAEAGLRMSSFAARGLWIDLLCFMFRGEKRGQLTVNGRAMTFVEIANMVGKPEAEVKQVLSELETSGVFSTTDDKTIYSRRMVKDEQIRLSKVEAGRKGGLKSATIKSASKTQAKGGSPTPTPSSSSTPTSKEKDNIGVSSFKINNFTQSPEYPEPIPETQQVVEAWADQNRVADMNITNRVRDQWDQCVRAHGIEACMYYISRYKNPKAGYLTDRINKEAKEELGYFDGLRLRQLRKEAGVND